MNFLEALMVVLGTIFSYGLAGVILLNVAFAIVAIVLGIIDEIAGTEMLEKFLPM